MRDIPCGIGNDQDTLTRLRADQRHISPAPCEQDHRNEGRELYPNYQVSPHTILSVTR
jgi:hypothetical protein